MLIRGAHEFILMQVFCRNPQAIAYIILYCTISNRSSSLHFYYNWALYDTAVLVVWTSIDHIQAAIKRFIAS